MENSQLNPYWSTPEVAMKGNPLGIVPEGRDEQEYFEELRARIRECATPTIQLSARVMAPGFQDRETGSRITGHLLAKSVEEGQVEYWLVYQPGEDEYYRFWGPNERQLGAYGVAGNPIYCWWD